MNKTILIAVIAVIVVGAGAFFAGMKYQETKRTTTFRQQLNGRTGGGQFQGNGNRTAGLRPVSGDIISADDKSITVKLADGSSKIVIFSATTEINKANKVGKEELKTGEKVAVFGTQNSDGSVTAQNIQLGRVTK